MMTSEFETSFYETLKQYLERHHRGLRCITPPSGLYIARGHAVPSPDVIVENPSTGAMLAIEIKGERYGDSLPFATLPQLKAMRDALEPLNAELVLISVADVPEPVLARLHQEHITVAHAKTVGQALEQIKGKLCALEKGEEG